ncbi:MAG: peptide deformylase [Patescibacteria group bacterium]
MLPLIIAPHPLLRQVAAPIDLSAGGLKLRSFVKKMYKAMLHYDGIGLAAPQVGQSVRLMVMNTPGEPTVYFNPEILKTSWRKIVIEEGCLSVPDVYGLVKRPARIQVRYQTLMGEIKQEWLDDLWARVYQHEVDHLNGVLFIDLTRDFLQGKELLNHYLGASAGTNKNVKSYTRRR